MKSRMLKIIARLSDLGFDQHLKEKVKLYFEGSLSQKEYHEIHKLIIFVEEVLDERLFKKRESQCPP